MLVLLGKGGIYKTTLLGSILPPCLADYYANDSTGNYLDKDMQEAHACKGHICLDEFEATYGKNPSAFKSNMTKESFSIRRPYDKFRSELMHRSSLSGTSNEQHIITDVENCRYSHPSPEDNDGGAAQEHLPRLPRCRDPGPQRPVGRPQGVSLF